MAESWRNRIVGHGAESPDRLAANPRNWRLHPKSQQDALVGVLADVGWVQDVVVNQTTGFILDGHLRVATALAAGQASIPVVYVDLTPDEEALILATLDPLGAMAEADTTQLRSLLADVTTDSAAVQTILTELAEAAEAATLREIDPDTRSKGMTVTTATTVRPVLALADVAVFDQAIQATGLDNRGEALMAICRAYLGETRAENR